MPIQKYIPFVYCDKRITLRSMYREALPAGFTSICSSNLIYRNIKSGTMAALYSKPTAVRPRPVRYKIGLESYYQYESS
jgi:hypothetical protein